MTFNFVLIINSILMGIGLAMDAFSVSMVNGLKEPTMKFKKITLVAGIFGLFQFLMPLIGWVCIHTIASYFDEFAYVSPWISLILLLYIGGNMIIEGIKKKDDEQIEYKKLLFRTLIVQGIATSIDALSVGFTIAQYSIYDALLSTLIIGIVTYFICIIGIYIGKKVGDKLSNKADILGGVILICIGIEIFITGLISVYA